MHPFSRYLSFLAAFGAVTSALSAQNAPAAPPLAASHAHGAIVTLDHFVTSATPFPRNQIELAQATTVLSGRSLLLKQQATIGETLAAETGISAASFGPGSSRPIIRGLGGDRIRLLENGIATLDASVTSPDHAVSVEPFLVERIEVVRGPASLLYGSNAVGGAINVITHRIETELPAESIRGGGEIRGNSAADEFARGGVVDLAWQPGPDQAVIFHADLFRRQADDLRIPGFAESARVRAEETEEAAEEGEPAPEFARGRLPNSALDVRSGAAGLSFVARTFHAGMSYSGFETDYGVPGHAHGEEGGVRIALRQRRTDFQSEWRSVEGAWLTGARLKFGYARYRHEEREPDGAVGTEFTNRGFDGRFELLHAGLGAGSGAIGAHATRADFRASGEEAFLPPSLTTSQALFTFQELPAGPLTWQLGARLERTRVRPEGGRTLEDTEPSASVGLVWDLDAVHTLALALAHTGRAANAQERFADGPHLGTQAYEIGNPTLSPERSLGVDLSLRRRSGFVTGAVTLFVNNFNGYIFDQPTGLVASEHDGVWELEEPGDGHAHEALPVFQTVQRDARFWGAEVETLWHLHEKRDWQLDLRLAADLTRARQGGQDLPRIPAARTTAGLLWANAHWHAGVECQWVFAQRRVARHEHPSDGYTLINAHLSRTVELGHRTLELFLRATNLGDVEVRPHASPVKDLAPLAGRAVAAGVRFAF